MTSLGSSLSSGTSRAGSAWTSRYSTGVRTSSKSTGLPRSRMASSSLGVIVATLISSSLRLLKPGTRRRSPCYNILGFVNNYIPVWLLSQEETAPNPKGGPHSGQCLQHLEMFAVETARRWSVGTKHQPQRHGLTGRLFVFKPARSHSLPGPPRRSRHQGCQGVMHLASYVGILVVRQRFECLEGGIGAAGRDPGELRRGHDPDPRIFVLERLHQLLKSCVGIRIEPEGCRQAQGRVLALRRQGRIEFLRFEILLQGQLRAGGKPSIRRTRTPIEDQSPDCCCSLFRFSIWACLAACLAAGASLSRATISSAP